MDTGKTLIVTKVFDTNCDVCKHMSKHDRVTFEEFPEITYTEIHLDDIINHNNNRTKLVLYQCLERYCLTPTYEIDLPVYVFLSKTGEYKGHISGAATIVELREKTKEVLAENV